MASPEFVRELPHESSAWARDGIVTPEQARLIVARYPEPAPGASSPHAAGSSSTAGGVLPVLYATAGVLLGAAGIAFVVVGLGLDEPEQAAAVLAAVGLLLSGGGVALRFTRAQPLLADALLVSGLPALAAATAAESPAPYLALGLAVPAALIAWRRDSGFVAPLAVIAFSVAAGVGLSNLFEGGTVAPWAAVQLALLVGVVAVDRVLRERDDVVAAAFATAAFAISVVAFLAEDVLQQATGEVIEVVLGLVMLVVLGIGVTIKHRGLLIGAATVIGIDAIVFAFDVGGVFTGTAVLVALAALLVWQAEFLRRHLSTT